MLIIWLSCIHFVSFASHTVERYFELLCMHQGLASEYV